MNLNELHALTGDDLTKAVKAMSTEELKALNLRNATFLECFTIKEELESRGRKYTDLTIYHTSQHGLAVFTGRATRIEDARLIMPDDLTKRVMLSPTLAHFYALKSAGTVEQILVTPSEFEAHCKQRQVDYSTDLPTEEEIDALHEEGETCK